MAPDAPFISKLYQGVEKDSIAFKMMKRMGWDEGKGLGKEGQGISTHVRVTKKFDNSGIGIAEEKKKASDWTAHTVVFDNILKNLNVKIVGSVATKADLGHSSSDSEVDVEESHSKKRQSVAVEINKVVRKIARPQGRYKKREAGKAVKSYSKEDLAAILGEAQPSPSVSVQSVEEPEVGIRESSHSAKKHAKPKKRATKRLEAMSDPTEVISSPSSSISTSSIKLDEPKLNSGESKLGTSRSRSNDDSGDVSFEKPPTDFPSSSSTSCLSTQIKSTPPPASWWGDKFGFVRAGYMDSMYANSKPSGSLTAAKSGIPDKDADTDDMNANVITYRRAFNEQDQENLYNLVQDKSTSGKKGLGVGDRAYKKAKVSEKQNSHTFF